VGIDAIHPGVLDSDLFSNELAFLPQALILCRQPHAAANVASSHPSGLDDGKMGKGDRM
jgi:hypothetical protein